MGKHWAACSALDHQVLSLLRMYSSSVLCLHSVVHGYCFKLKMYNTFFEFQYKFILDLLLLY